VTNQVAETLDFFEEGISEDSPVLKASDDGMKRLSDLVQQQINIEDELEGLNEALEECTLRLARIRADLIPELMDELGFMSFVTMQGDKVEIKPIVQASVPKEEPYRSNALQWLRDEGHGDVIKNIVSVQFGRGEDERAIRLVRELEEKGLDVKQDVSVHAMTLAALVRQLREEGRPVDTRNLKVYEGKISRIKRSRKN
jgi:hypothetical protein